MIGTTVLLYGLINPVGVAPIYLSLVRRISPDRAHRIVVVSAATVAVLVAGTLWLASPIKRLLGNTGINIATRLMALVVASVAIDFIMTGIKHQLAGLALKGGL
jgi:multiple antibiotic resistance protein